MPIALVWDSRPGQHREHRIHARNDHNASCSLVRHVEAWRRWTHEDGRARLRQQGHPGECRLPRLRPNRPD